jgi:predicted HTH domain antitoxin
LYRAAAEDLVSLNKAASLANMKVADFRKEFVLL